MAFTRKFLKALGIADEAIDSIMDAHTEVTNALVAERDAAKQVAPDVAQLTKERDELKKQLAQAKADGASEVQQAFDAYKKAVEAEKLNASKAEAVKALLRESGVQRDDFVSLLLGQVDMNKVELKDGKVQDAAFVDALKTTYAGCFGKVEQIGAGANNPPSGGNQQMSKEAFFKLPLHEQMKFANAHPAEWAEYNK